MHEGQSCVPALGVGCIRALAVSDGQRTEDRYTCDVHSAFGLVLIAENTSWKGSGSWNGQGPLQIAGHRFR